MYWKDKKVVVTGGAGFIGQHLVDRLIKEGAKVIILDQRQPNKGYTCKASTIIMDVLNPSHQLKKYVEEADVIYHLAAYSSAAMFQDFSYGYMANVKGVLTILDLASKVDGVRRIVFPSSSTVYSGHQFPWTEDLPLDSPVNWYAASKLTGEFLCKHYEKYRHVEAVCLRIFCGYGPGEEHKRVYASPISQFVWSMMKEQAPEVWGKGMQERDFIYIDDVVDALLLAASEPVSGEVFNIGTGMATSFIDTIQVINDKLGTSISPKFVKPKIASYLDKTLSDVRKAEKILKFKAKTRLKEGVTNLINSIISKQKQVMGR